MSTNFCQVGLEPCVDLAHCDEVGDVCLACVIDAECDDAVACTDDLCDAGTCSNTSNCGSGRDVQPHHRHLRDDPPLQRWPRQRRAMELSTRMVVPGESPPTQAAPMSTDPSEKDDTGVFPCDDGVDNDRDGRITSIGRPASIPATRRIFLPGGGPRVLRTLVAF